ncbi:hypothetical protein M8J77_009021 [Diaphorina citri]|nr:hypothetical protein M8J77_009021 [Diaphorina citri]
MVDKLDYRRHSLSRLYKDDKSYKDNFSRTYNSENVEKILSKTRSLISDFDSGKSGVSSVYSTLPPRFRLSGSKYSSSYISSGSSVSSRSYKSRSPSYSSSTVKSPSLARRSLYEPRSVSPSPALQSTPRSASITNGDIERSPVSSALPPRIISDLCIPKAGAAGGSSAVNGLPPPSHRRSSATLSPAALSSAGSASINVPPALASSLSNSVKYERCYNDLLSRINHIKMNGGDTLHEGRTSLNIPEFDRSKKPIQDRLHHYDRRDSSVAGTNVGPGLTGLKNLGNTCYINSILQCLSNTSPLREYFVTEFKRSMTAAYSKTSGKLAEEFQLIFNMLWAGDSRYFSPQKFKKSSLRVTYGTQGLKVFVNFEGLFQTAK